MLVIKKNKPHTAWIPGPSVNDNALQADQKPITHGYYSTFRDFLMIFFYFPAVRYNTWIIPIAVTPSGKKKKKKTGFPEPLFTDQRAKCVTKINTSEKKTSPEQKFFKLFAGEQFTETSFPALIDPQVKTFGFFFKRISL